MSLCRTMTTSTAGKGGCPRDWPGTSHLSSFLTFPSPCPLSWGWTPHSSTPPLLMALRPTGSVSLQPLRDSWWGMRGTHYHYCKPLSCVHSNPHLNFELRFMYFHLVCCCGRQYKEPTTFLFHAKYSFPWQLTFLTLLKHSIRSNMKPDRDLGIFSSCIADSLP